MHVKAMAIVTSRCRISRQDGDFSPCTPSVEDENNSSMSQEPAGGSFSGDGASDTDSGLASDEFDLSELGESGTELCQVGNQSFTFSQELYDLPSLGSVLSLETWNQCLSEEERFALAEFLPDMDQENFAVTLKELFSGSIFYFGRPLEVFFNQMKGGLCNPKVVVYRRGLNIFQRHQHYHQLCEYHNSMVGNLVHIRDTWQNWGGYEFEERLRLLNVLRSQRSLGYDRNGGLRSDTDSGSSDSTDAYWSGRRFTKGCGEVNLSSKASFNAFTRRSRMAIHPGRPGRAKAKGILKVATEKVPAKKEYTTGPGFHLSVIRKSGADDTYFEDPGYGIVGRSVCGITSAKYSSLKFKRKDSRYAQDLRSHFGVEEADEYVGKSSYLNNIKESVHKVTVASYDYKSSHRLKKAKQSDKDWKLPAKEQLQHQVANESKFDWSDANRSCKRGKVYDETFSPGGPRTFDDLNLRGKEWKAEYDFRTSKSSFGSKVGSCKAPPAEWSDSHFPSDYRTKNLQGQLRRKSSKHGVGMEYSIDSLIYDPSEETQSDSSDRVEAGRDMYPYSSKSLYSNVAMEARQSEVKLRVDLKMPSKLAKFSKKVSQAPHGDMSGQTLEVEPSSRKVKKKRKGNDTNYLDNSKSISKRQVAHFSEKLQPATLGSCAADRKRIRTTDHSLQANDMCNHIRGITDEESLYLNARLTNMERQTNRVENKSQISSDFSLEDDNQERLSMPILACNSRSKKRKGKDGDEHNADLDEPIHRQYSPKRQIKGSSALKKKGKKKADAVVTSSVVTPEQIILEKRGSELEMDMKTHKKPFTLITPTIHTGFSFSIIHLLSAVRKALTTAWMEDTECIGSHLGKDDLSMFAKGREHKKFLHMLNDTYLSQSVDNLDGIYLGHSGHQGNLPSIRVQEIVDKVKSNPGDPCILETLEPLQDLVRGVLKIFSSKTAPLGAKGWKALVLYEKSIKSWSWVGPIPSSSSDNDSTEDETSAEAWGIPHKMLVKLVDAFANWLKIGQETLQQIGSLPAPPAKLPVVDYKDRFRDLRAQKSLNTISSSSEEVRAYFHREELLRYSIPYKAFHYIAHDGRKSIVAPLRRGGGKPTSKARDHYMLKPDRPPHVTVLCLVRDAAARLPGGIGTRADVCTLIRDSQYIVEDVTDAQVNQVISGALDRLHYERDPCVQFDGERKLWVYLHGDREEEDFEDDGTSSTKKWKRRRKDSSDPSEVETANDAIYLAPASGASSACEFNTEFPV